MRFRPVTLSVWLAAGLIVLTAAPAFAPPVALAAAGAALSGVIGGLTATTILINVALAAGGALLNMVLAGKPKAPSQGPQERRLTVRSAQAPRQVVYGETRVKDPVLIHFETTENEKKLHLVLAFAGHEIEAFERIWFNDEEIGDRDAEGNVTTGTFAGKARVRAHLGAPDQTVDTAAFDELENWSTTDRGRGIAYLYVTLTGSGTIFPTGAPAVSALIKGRKLARYASEATVWSDNAALAALDYLTNATYGFGASADFIDQAQALIDETVSDEIVGVVEQSIAYSADLETSEIVLAQAGFRTGDRVILAGDPPEPIDPVGVYYWIKTGQKRGRLAASLAGARASDRIELTAAGAAGQEITRSGQPRYTANGSFLTDRTPLDVLEDLAATLAARPALNASGYALRAGADQAPVGHLTADLLRGEIVVDPRRPFDEVYNAVGGVFRDADNLYAETDFPEQASTVFAAQDGGRKRRDVAHNFIDESQRAQRLARIDLAQSRQMIRVEWPGNLACLQFERGDLIEVTLAQAGWARKQFFVARDGFSGDGLGYDLTLVEAAAGLFDIDLAAMQAADPAPDTNLRVAGYLAPPAGVSFRTRPVNTAAGDQMFMIDVYGDAAPDPAATHYEAAVFAATDTAFEEPLDTRTVPGDPDGTFPFRAVLGPVAPTIELVIRLRAATWRAIRSDWVVSDEFQAADQIGGNGGGVSPSPGDAPAVPTGLANTYEVTGVPLPWSYYPGHYKSVSFSGGGGSGAAGTSYITPVEPADEYSIVLSAAGRGYTSAPNAISDETGFTIAAASIGNPTAAHLTWADPADSDLARIDIYRGPDSDSANAIKVAEALPGREIGSAKLTCAVAAAQYFFIKAVDLSGNESDFTAGVAVTRT